MDLEHLHMIINAWIAEQKELPSNTRVDITISLESGGAEVSTVVDAFKRMTLGEFLTYEKIMVGNNSRREIASRTLKYLRYDLDAGLFEDKIDWHEVPVKDFALKVKRGQLMRIPNFGRICMVTLNEALTHHGYPAIS